MILSDNCHVTLQGRRPNNLAFNRGKCSATSEQPSSIQSPTKLYPDVVGTHKIPLFFYKCERQDCIAGW